MSPEALPPDGSQPGPREGLYEQLRRKKEEADRIEANMRMAWKIAAAYGLKDADREDKAQDLFVGLLLADEMEAEQKYVRRAAHNQARGWWRDRNNRLRASLNALAIDAEEGEQLEAGDLQADPVDRFESWEFRVLLREIMSRVSRLPDLTQRREAEEYLARVLGLKAKSVNELAAELGRKPNTVTQDGLRVIRRIGRELGHLPPEADAA